MHGIEHNLAENAACHDSRGLPDGLRVQPQKVYKPTYANNFPDNI